MKLLTTLVTTVMLLTSQAILAAESLPERLYLVGNFNNWTVPNSNPNADQYSLTDEDGDGIYEGTFTIPSGFIEFKIFTAIGDWSDPSISFGTVEPMDNMYSDRNWIVNSVNGYVGNINISNWAGGDLSLRVKYISDGEFLVTGSGSQQPAFPQFSDNIYIIGSFNDFKLPDDTSDNGAIAVPVTDREAVIYSGSFDLPQGDVTFKIWCPKSELYPDGKLMGVSNNLMQDGQNIPLDLFRADENSNAIVRIYPGVNNLYLKDWNGTSVHISYPAILENDIFLTSSTAPIKAPQKFYALYSIDGAERHVMELYPFLNDYYLTSSLSFSNMEANEIEVLFTPENSENPSLFYGVAESEEANFFLPDDQDYWYSPVIYTKEGGKPIKISKNNDMLLSNITTHFDTAFKYGWVNLSLKKQIKLDELYLIGTPQNWDIYNGNIKIEKVDNGVYYGEIPVDSNRELIFRFYTKLGDWESGSIGSDQFDWDIPIAVPYYGRCMEGKGNWEITNFEGDLLKVTVDVNNWTVEFYSEESSVEEIFDGGLKVVGIYDINGISRKSLAPGINIVRYSDGTVKKIMH